MIQAQLFSTFLMLLTAVGVAFLVALWIGTIFWALRDIRSRSRDPFILLVAFLLTLLLPIIGIVVYLVLRPTKTIEEKYQAALTEEALLQELDAQPKCPGCGRGTETDWILCPACHTRLKKTCIQCGKILELPWNLCPYCAAPQQKPYKTSADK